MIVFDLTMPHIHLNDPDLRVFKLRTCSSIVNIIKWSFCTFLDHSIESLHVYEMFLRIRLGAEEIWSRHELCTCNL